MTMAVRRCGCFCHSAVRGDFESAKQHGDFDVAMVHSASPWINTFIWVDGADPVEAAVASGCHCIDNHTPALLDYLPPTDWTPDQADGEVGG